MKPTFFKSFKSSYAKFQVHSLHSKIAMKKILILLENLSIVSKNETFFELFSLKKMMNFNIFYW